MWSSLKIDGKSLPLVTVDLLVECGMAVGPSLKVVSKIQRLFGQGLVGKYDVFYIF